MVEVQVASDTPYDTIKGTPKAASIWRCKLTVIGAEPHRRNFSDRRFALS